MKDSKIFRIVLTGGPCSGKTTATSHIRDRLQSLGCDVYIVPEAATLMILGGISLLQGDVLSNQLKLLTLQKQLEDIFISTATSTAQKNNKPAVVICDRGVMDNKAFMSDSMWNDYLAATTDTLVELRDQRYDAVIHLVTAAVGAPNFYTLTNNSARSETLERAIFLDQKIQEAWIGHPHFRVIGNHTDFNEKIRQVVAAVCNSIGIPHPLERERKFLIKNFHLNSIPSHRETLEIEQTYLSSPTGTARVRKRGQHNSFTFTHTIKHKLTSRNNIEQERRITEQEYLVLLSQADPSRHTIRKERTCFLWNNQYFELDYFLSPYPGLWLLEVELEDDDVEVKLPDFITIAKEVTDDPSYSNAELARQL